MQLSTGLPFPTSRALNTDERLRADLSSRLDIDQLLKQIDAKSGLSGAGVIYFNGLDLTVIREFQPGCLRDPVNVIIRAVPKGQVSASQPTNAALEQQNKPMYSAALEATSAAVACGAAVLGWVVVFGSGIAAVPTAGATGAFAVLALSATIASSAQCVVGAARTYAIVGGHQEDLAWFDSQAWYNQTMTALDLISLAGAGGAVVGTIRTLKALKASGSTSVIQALRQMPRHDRKRLTEELIRQLNPGISNSSLKAMIRAGVYPARLTSVQVSAKLRQQLYGAVGATLSFSGSALSGTVRNPSRTKDLVFGITYPIRTL